MIKPPLHPLENLRIRLADSFRIMDTKEESSFNGLTRLAASYFNVKYCLITFLDAERQWFKSHHGTDISETSRDISICGHAILESSKRLVVNDLSKDLRFADNPLIKGKLKLKFYASHLIQGLYDAPIGSFCILDDQPRAFSAKDKKDLEYFSSICLELLESRKANLLNSEITKKLKRKDEDLELIKTWFNRTLEGHNLESKKLVLNLMEETSDLESTTQGLKLLLKNLNSEKNELDDLKSLLSTGLDQKKENVNAAELIYDSLSIYQLAIDLKSDIENVILNCSPERLKLAFDSVITFLTQKNTSNEIEVSTMVSKKTLVIVFKKNEMNSPDKNKSLITGALELNDGLVTKQNSKLFVAKSALVPEDGKIWSYGAEKIGFSLLISLPIYQIEKNIAKH